MKKGILSGVSAAAGAVIGAGTTGKILGRELKKTQAMSDKHLALFIMMNKWVRAKQEGRDFASFFRKKGYKKIAIYGMSYVGESLVKELEGTDVQIMYGIDQSADSIYSDIDIISPNGDLHTVDAVIVTAITFFDEIEEKLSEKINCPIISLEDVIYEA